MSDTAESATGTSKDSSQNVPSVDTLAEGLEKTVLEGDTPDTQAASQQESAQSRPLVVYTRKQLVFLSQSPLVKVPEGMPEFKVWFGELNEQALSSMKRDTDSTSSNGAMRERRFRREPEDGDGSSRPQFRSGLSQPSQMGNFKLQSTLRPSDRDRDTERDLRSLSDRYDRDKATRGIGSHSSLLRTRDRDSAPHLTTDRDGQRTSGRKRNGESKEDWRRGAEPPRSGRDENNSRRDRDDRERQRSRARDNSRTRDSPPATRREREEQRRDRDRERFDEAGEDRKRWREDGKRDDKSSSRREKDGAGREKDYRREHSRDTGTDRDGWTLTDDKRRGARDRRHDDARDKEDKREREKEKEPAWMETYVPPPSSTSGILGGKGGEGELDSIQAWKKDMKEREMKAKGLIPEAPAATAPTTESAVEEAKPAQAPIAQPEGQLDEIQLFKLMMKKEQERAASANSNGVRDDQQTTSDAALKAAETGVHGSLGTQEGRTTASTAADRGASPSATSPANGVAGSIDPLLAAKSTIALKPPPLAPLVPSPSGIGAPASASNNIPSSSLSNGPRLLSLKTSETTVSQETAIKDGPGSATSFDPPRTSRLLALGAQSAKVTVQPSPQSAAAAAQMNRLQQMDPLWSNQRRTSVSPAMPYSASQQSAFDKPVLQQQQQLLAGGQLDMNVAENLPRRSGPDSLGYNTLYENAPRSANALDATREITSIDTGRSSIPLSASERTVFMSQPESLQHLADVRRNPTPPTAGFGVTSPISPFDSQMGSAQNTYSLGKGSRMAKHFERQRDQTLATAGRNVPLSGLGPNGLPQNRQEPPPLNNPVAPGEGRNIQDLLTMLNNSAQAQQRNQLNQNLGQHQPAQSLHIGPSNASLNRLDPLLDNDDRFAPDGLVPGLRPAIPPRAREMNASGLYANQLDEQIVLNARLGAQQRGNLDHLVAGQIPSQFNGQGINAGRGGLSLQQQAMRGGPSPINNFNPTQGLPQQRLPPGLANLGSRPPHEPSQFLGGGAGNFGVPSQLHAGLQHGNNPQSFNQFQNPGLGMVGNQTHLRGQPGLGQLGNGLNSLDFRGGPGGPTQNQLLGLGGPNLGQAMRGGGPGFHTQQLHGPNQVHPSLNVRQQQNLQPQMLQQLLPQQLQSIPPGQHNPNDLMALLMGNAHRE